MGDFTNASHELRTPLTIVQGYLELLREMGDTRPDLRQAFLSQACRACDELVVLLANIMDAGRLQFDAATLHITPIPLKDVTTAITELFEPLVMKKEQTITLEIDAHIIVRADEARLKQEAIFGKFVRLERDMHGVVRGSGLGLFISRQLVEAMKGTMRVESSGIENEGSTFSFTLPLDEPDCLEADTALPLRTRLDQRG